MNQKIRLLRLGMKKLESNTHTRGTKNSFRCKQTLRHDHAFSRVACLHLYAVGDVRSLRYSV